MLNHSALTERIGVDVQVIGSDRINIVAIRDLDAAEEVARRSAQRTALQRGAAPRHPTLLVARTLSLGVKGCSLGLAYCILGRRRVCDGQGLSRV